MSWILVGILVVLLIIFINLWKKEKKRTDEYLSERFDRYLEDHKQDISILTERTAALIKEINQLTLQKTKLDEQVVQGQKLVDKEIELYRTQKFGIIDRDIALRTFQSEKEFADKVAENQRNWNSFHEEYLKNILFMNEEKEEIQQILDDFKARRDVINQDIMRERALEEEKDFYRIGLTKMDIEDISSLKTLIPQMCNKNLVPKLMWDAIVARPAQEMIKRVFSDAVGGIYKCTYIPTGEVYIGKTTNFKTRIANHLKTVLGIEGAAAPSTFHAHMTQHGIENYTWEMLEELPKEQQSEREKYWIEFFESNKYGLNMRVG